MTIFMDLALDQVDAHLRIDPTDESLRKQELIPALIFADLLKLPLKLV